MNRTHSIRTAALIALPFLLLPAGVWLANTTAELWYIESAPFQPWQGVRWLQRFVYIGGAILGWRARRPIWFYPWLSFAVYETVAVLMLLAVGLLAHFWNPFLEYVLASSLSTTLLLLAAAFYLLVLPFSPSLAVYLWPGRQPPEKPLIAYTAFPPAALTIPLVLATAIVEDGGMAQFATEGMPPLATLFAAVCAATSAVLFWRPPLALFRGRTKLAQMAVLFGGVPLCHSLFWTILIGYSFGEQFDYKNDIQLILTTAGLGWLILSGPLLVPPFVHWLIGKLGIENTLASSWNKVARIFPESTRATKRSSDSTVLPQSEMAGHDSPQGEANMSEETVVTAVPETRRPVGSDLERLYKVSIVVLAALAVFLVALYVGRAAVYKIHEFERGLHLRGGRFLGVQTPGWHVQVPLVDTVIIVKVIERLGYVERIPAMTSDNVTMDVSLQFTYRVTNPERFALAVDDPERIVFEFVQGRLRDVINTKTMTGVMNQRTEMNLEIMQELKEKEDQYGVEFMTVQIQSASPPAEVLSAIKDRMVAAQRQEQAEAEAAQQRTVADAQFYAAQKEAEAQAYRITTSAAAEAEQIQLTTEAQQLAVRAILSELEGKGTLAEKYIDYLIAVELKENSKWILGTGAEPILELRPSAEE